MRNTDREQAVEILHCLFLNEASFETPALATSTTSRSSTRRRTSNASFWGLSAVAKSAGWRVRGRRCLDLIDHRVGLARGAAIVDQHLSARFPEG